MFALGRLTKHLSYTRLKSKDILH